MIRADKNSSHIDGTAIELIAECSKIVIHIITEACEKHDDFAEAVIYSIVCAAVRNLNDKAGYNISLQRLGMIMMELDEE